MKTKTIKSHPFTKKKDVIKINLSWNDKHVKENTIFRFTVKTRFLFLKKKIYFRIPGHLLGRSPRHSLLRICLLVLEVEHFDHAPHSAHTWVLHACVLHGSLCTRSSPHVILGWLFSPGHILARVRSPPLHSLEHEDHDAHWDHMALMLHSFCGQYSCWTDFPLQ